MTAASSGHVMWSPHPLRQRLAASTVEVADTGTELVLSAPFAMRLPIRDIAP